MNNIVKRCPKCNKNYVRCHNYCPSPKGKKMKNTKIRELELLQEKLESYFDMLCDEYPSLQLSTSGSVALNAFEITSELLNSSSVKESKN